MRAKPQRGQRLGSGSSRIVYEYGNKVIKIARPNSREYGRGQAQNRVEYEVYQYRFEQRITCLCPIYALDEHDKHLVMARAQPIAKTKDMDPDMRKRVQEFKRMLKFLDEALRYHQNIKEGYPALVRRLNWLKYDEEQTKILQSRLCQNLCKLISFHDLAIADLVRASSWGIYRDRFVLIDYGASWKVLREYYRR